MTILVWIWSISVGSQQLRIIVSLFLLLGTYALSSLLCFNFPSRGFLCSTKIIYILSPSLWNTVRLFYFLIVEPCETITQYTAFGKRDLGEIFIIIICFYKYVTFRFYFFQFQGDGAFETINEPVSTMLM